MYVDERIYTLKNGKVGDFLKLYEAEGKDVQVRILGNMIGYFHTDIGPLNQIVHMWGYESLDERQRLRAELQASDEWQAYARQMRPLVQSIENKILIPEPWSPIGGENKN